MATAKPKSPHLPRRRWRRVLLLLALAAVLALAFAWQSIRANAVTATAYGARVACSCRFIAGRELSSCRDDFEPGMGLVMLSEDDEARSVTARVPLFAGQTATWREASGCQLERWEN